MKANLSLIEAPHTKEVPRMNLVTLLAVTNSRSNQLVDQPLDRRSKGTLLGRPRNIAPPSMTPNLYIVVILGWPSSADVKINNKKRGLAFSYSIQIPRRLPTHSS